MNKKNQIYFQVKSLFIQTHLILGLLRRRSARLQHLLHDVEPDAGLGLVLRHGKVAQHVVVAEVRRLRIPVLVREPLELGRVGVPRADVLTLQMLELAVDVVAVAHGQKVRGKYGSGGTGYKN